MVATAVVCAIVLILANRYQAFQVTDFKSYRPFSSAAGRVALNRLQSTDDGKEPMFSLSYDPLEQPSQNTLERDLEDMLLERSLRFYDQSVVQKDETCYLVGLEDKSLGGNVGFSMEESLTELSELAGAAGLTVVGSTYQRVSTPNIEVSF